jgi:hypothetical protein
MSATEMTRDPAAELFARNLAALEQHVPLLVPVLREMEATRTRILGRREDGDLNLDLGHARLYEPDAVSYVDSQLENYRRRPLRMFINLPTCPPQPELVPHFVLQPVFEHFRDRGVPAYPTSLHEPAGFMIVFGIGLGLHLGRLVETYECRHLILVEQFHELVYHSLHAVDWAEWLERLAARGGSVRILIGQDPAQMAHRVYWDLRHTQFGLIDGTYVFKHYSSYLLDRTEELFREKLPVLGVAAGFFEDEKKMLRHTFANLMDYEFSLLEPRPRPEKPVPALIVGSGPSIDGALDELRRLREHAILISCGTALGVLLRNGIKPDFHCEMENDVSQWEHLSDYRKWTDFAGITLIASTTVDPRVPGLFSERIFYFRDTVSSTGFFGKGFRQIYGAAPTVTNLGLRVAFTLGFTEVYLFGVDLGTRSPEIHHSKDSFYLTDEKWQATYTKEIEPMCHELPANFGGLAYTNRVLLWARLMMSGLLEQYRERKVYNCSDGVQIARTVPRLARRVHLTASVLERDRTLARLRGEVDRKAPGELVDRAAIVAVRGEFAEFYGMLQAVIATAREEAWAFPPFHDAIDELLRAERFEGYPECLRNVNNGSFMTVLQCGYFLARRLEEADRPSFMRIYLAALADVVERMAGDVDSWLVGFLATIDHRQAA